MRWLSRCGRRILYAMTRVTWFAAALSFIAAACGGSPDTGGPRAPLPGDSVDNESRQITQGPKATLAGTVHAEHGQAPGGTVFHPEGAELDLATTYADSNAIILFYRGHW